MSPDESKQPARHGHENEQLPEHKNIPAPVATLHFVDPLPSHHQQPGDRDQVRQRHKNFSELVSLLHPTDPVAPVVPIQSVLPRSFSRR